jgi:hypothetical protein
VDWVRSALSSIGSIMLGITTTLGGGPLRVCVGTGVTW